MKTILQPMIPDMPHPFRRDTDGGALMIAGTKAAGFQRAQARQLFAWTPERQAAATERNAQHEAWKASPAGKAWLQKAGLS